MIGFSIRINRVGDPPTPLFTDNDAPFEEIGIVSTCILEKGTVGGQTTVTIGMEGADGKHYVAQTTKGLLEGLLAAIKGSEANWKENSQ